MSSDRKEPDAVWTGSTSSSTWNPSNNQAAPFPPKELIMESEGEQEVPDYFPLDDAQGEAPGSLNNDELLDKSDIAPDNNGLELLNESGIAPELEPEKPVSPLEQLWYYTTLIIFPLLFSGITALVVIPPVVAGQAHLPPGAFIPLVVVLIVLALVQAGIVYILRSIHHMGLLSSIGALLLFLVIGSFALSGPIGSLILLIIAVALVVYVIRRYMHSVPEGFADVVVVQGKYSRTLYSGISLLMPWEKIKGQVNVEEIHWVCPPQKVQLSEQVDVVLRALVSYHVQPEDAYLALTMTKNWEENLREVVLTTIQTVATAFVPSDFLSWHTNVNSQTYQSYSELASSPFTDEFVGSLERRNRINNYILQQVRARVAPWGINVNWIGIRDVELAPHGLAIVEHEPVPIDIDAMLHDVPTEFLSSKGATSASTAGDNQEAAKPKQPIVLPKEDVLVQAYKTVQNGKVTDPLTIRRIADTFQAVADDPEASAAMSFDAARAAQNLYEQARLYEERLSKNTIYDDTTRPDMVLPVATPPDA